MRPRPARLLLSLAAALLALAGAEAAWRLLRTDRFGPTTNPRYVLHDAELGWRYRPGARVRHVSDAFDVEVAINADGFRGEDFPAPGDAPRPLVVALGDSQTFGWGVDVGEAFPSRLQALVGARVLDLGVSGFGTDQELLLWRREGPVRRPDVVVLTACANDTREVVRAAMYGREKPWFELSPTGLQACGLPVPRRAFAEWSHLLRSGWSAWLKAGNPPLDPDEVEPARRLQAELTRTLAREVRASGARLLVVVEDEPWLQVALGDEAGVATLDVGPDLRDAAAEGPVRFATDPHWNAHGHEVVARRVAAALRSLGWLP